jgi:hypothetical protein
MVAEAPKDWPEDAAIMPNARRILKMLAVTNAKLIKKKDVLAIVANGKMLGERAIDPRWLAMFLREGWIAPIAEPGGTTFRLTTSGHTECAGETSMHFADNHRVLETKLVGVADGQALYATVNVAESPLAWLRSRAGGQALTADEYDAGERLREDFTMAQLSPRITVDWSRPLVDRQSAGNGVEAMGYSVIAAKARVTGALTAIGPGLGDVLLSVCCYLQGLEETEQKLQWPRRSAKLVLKLALARLAEYYGLRRKAN